MYYVFSKLHPSNHFPLLLLLVGNLLVSMLTTDRWIDRFADFQAKYILTKCELNLARRTMDNIRLKSIPSERALNQQSRDLGLLAQLCRGLGWLGLLLNFSKIVSFSVI